MQRLLVANRGEIARRIFRTCRRLEIGTVAVFSEPDADAPFVHEADVAVALGGRTPGESYLRIDALLEAATRTGADAIHPGYGFLAENAGFARAVLDAGLTWVGPSPEAIETMGSKIEARTRMEAAGVPVVPRGEDAGFPVLVKASAGGGGKGMRVVRSADELEDAIAAAQREAESAFGDGTVFLERYVEGARHVEIQIVGDTHGTVVSLHERDCSVQRRHQKVIEEAPSPAVDAQLRSRMGDAAVAAGEALSYVGAGTVEFLLTPDGEYFFLEVNTRLQVEHPVTELVTGLDLVELQLRVATGEPLPPVPPISGHAVEARLYAEDPANGFLPVTGTLSRFSIPGDVRVDGGVEDGSVVSPYYDPMLAKVIAHGATRAEACRKLAGALARAQLHGTTTNRDFLVRVLRHPEFLGGEADTGFLDRHDDLAAPLVADPRPYAAALALARAAGRRAGAQVGASLPSGWRNVGSGPQRADFGEGLDVEYRHARGGLELHVGGEPLASSVRLHACTPSLVDLELDGIRRRYRVSGDAVNTDEGQVVLFERPRFPDPTAAAQAGSLTSPMPGAVVRVLSEQGAAVAAGQPLLVLEAMKMEHEIVAPVDGTLADLRVQQGTQVEAGAVLAVIE